MKVALVSQENLCDHPTYNFTGYANKPVIERMPNVEMVICRTLADLKKQAPTSDVVLLEPPRVVAFRDELGFLNKLPCLVGGFHLDSWKGPYWSDYSVDVDLYFAQYKTVTQFVKKEMRDPDKFVWQPPRVDIYDFETERDIDVVTWGALGREYSFRMFAHYAMVGLVKAGARNTDLETKNEGKHFLNRKIILNDSEYWWGRILAKRRGTAYHGPALAKILHRCKICPTGPPHQKNHRAPVARYIENAASGVVSVSCEIDEMEGLGLEHGKNIWITTAEHFMKDITYLLENPQVVEEIGTSAKQLVLERHTVDVRSQELYKLLCERTGKR